MSKLAVTIDGVHYEVEIDLNKVEDSVLHATIQGQPVRVVLPDTLGRQKGMEWIVVDDRPYEILCDPDLEWIKDQYGVHSLDLREAGVKRRQPDFKDGRVRAPIPGLVTRIPVEVGESVEAGQPVIILEAMKMFNELLAPRAGKIAAVHASPGQAVSRGEVLVEIVDL